MRNEIFLQRIQFCGTPDLVAACTGSSINISCTASPNQSPQEESKLDTVQTLACLTDVGANLSVIYAPLSPAALTDLRQTLKEEHSSPYFAGSADCAAIIDALDVALNNSAESTKILAIGIKNKPISHDYGVFREAAAAVTLSISRSTIQLVFARTVKLSPFDSTASGKGIALIGALKTMSELTENVGMCISKLDLVIVDNLSVASKSLVSGVMGIDRSKIQQWRADTVGHAFGIEVLCALEDIRIGNKGNSILKIGVVALGRNSVGMAVFFLNL